MQIRRSHSVRFVNARVWNLETRGSVQDCSKLWADVSKLVNTWLGNDQVDENGELNYAVLRPRNVTGNGLNTRDVQLEVANWDRAKTIEGLLEKMVMKLPFLFQKHANAGANTSRQYLKDSILDAPADIMVTGFTGVFTTQDVSTMLALYGKVLNVMFLNPETNGNILVAKVRMQRFGDAIHARNDLDGCILDGGCQLRAYPAPHLIFPTFGKCPQCGREHYLDLPCYARVCCKLCSLPHHTALCNTLAQEPSLILDSRTPSPAKEAMCPCCHQRYCSVPCKWSVQWAKQHGLEPVLRAFQDGIPDDAWTKNRDVRNHPFLEEAESGKSVGPDNHASSQSDGLSGLLVSAITSKIDLMVQAAPAAIRQQIRTESLAFGQNLEQMMTAFLGRMAALCQGTAAIAVGPTERSQTQVEAPIPTTRSAEEDISTPKTASSRRIEECDSRPRKIKKGGETKLPKASPRIPESAIGDESYLHVTNGYDVLQNAETRAIAGPLRSEEEMEEPLPPGTHV